MRFHLAPALCVIALLSACGGAEFAPAGSGGPIGTEPSSEPGTTPSTGNPPNTLPQSGQGNSGGVLAGDGDVAAGVEATMYYNSYRGRGAPMRANGAGVNFHNGDLTGVSVNCSRAGGGATVPECEVANAERAYLVNELSGTYAYAGSFAIEGHGPNGDQNSFVAIHSGPGMSEDEFVQLPGDDVNYSGRFQAGAGVTRNGVTYEGRANGSMDLNADFNAGSLSGDFNGHIYDESRDTYVELTAGFEDAVIGPDGRFYNTEDTGFSYNGSQAWGELDGAFYGPNAEEAAGTFGFGNDSGGMTGIMLGCSEHSGVNCVAPSPRF
ncbi:transferrin-binding protein-like solute binding protein [Roseibaca sp. Y0-43]|uniref:transferrin-binding protein-like solute binding protein n=1 Tax=Roseibaca sp. Y0-43 TaxID=2816854 RepID=UPI001D0C781F|nr:transferrin-binding protein-like solute binding protein [Roseibaca sp. Y0-43]MCC1482022.1 transferrin-binding protein-like solute binding protein [Roseibaca sp. Y0-43]